MPPRPAPAPLSNLERLLLTQAVYELGAASTAWTGVSKILSKHPAIFRPKTYFSPTACSTMYTTLMEEAQIERTDQTTGPRGSATLKLAQIFYRARTTELRKLIEEEESNFKRIATEIEQIRNGEWDDRIKRETLGVQIPVAGPSTISVPPEEPQPIVLPTILPHGLVDRGLSPKRIDKHTMDMDLSTTEPTVVPSPHLRSPSPSSRRTSPRRRHSPFKRDTVSPPREDPVASEENGSGDESQRRGVADTTTPDEGSRSASVALDVDSPGASSTKPRPIVKRTRGRANTIPRLSSEEATPGPEAEDNDTPGADRTATPDIAGRRASKRRASVIESAETGRDKKKTKVETEDGGVPTTKNKSRKAAANNAKKFHNIIGPLHDVISEHRNGNVFHNPIKKSEAPDYADIVKRPMDLKTIKTRAKDGLITSSLEYKRDIFLMFCNALMYNRPGSDIYNMAEQMMLDSEESIATFQSNEITSVQ